MDVLHPANHHRSMAVQHYALVALGYTMVYDIMGLINFAHGEVVMMALWSPSQSSSSCSIAGAGYLILLIALTAEAVVRRLPVHCAKPQAGAADHRRRRLDCFAKTRHAGFAPQLTRLPADPADFRN